MIMVDGDDEDYNINFGNNDMLIHQDERATNDQNKLNFSTLIAGEDERYSGVNPNQPKERMSLRILDNIDAKHLKVTPLEQVKEIASSKRATQNYTREDKSLSSEMTFKAKSISKGQLRSTSNVDDSQNKSNIMNTSVKDNTITDSLAKVIQNDVSIALFDNTREFIKQTEPIEEEKDEESQQL